jgi:hypothetical protein
LCSSGFEFFPEREILRIRMLCEQRHIKCSTVFRIIDCRG